MPYPELVALLDSKIARLRYARELLSTSALPEILIPEPVITIPAVETVSSEVTETAAAEPLRKVRRILPRARRERRQVAKARPVEHTALRSSLPAGPVFVPATRLPRPDSVASAETLDTSADMPTAAQLTQRWLRATS